MKQKLIRITTIPQSLGILLKGQLNYMSEYYEVVGIASGTEYLDKLAAQEGVRTIPVEMTRKITPVADMKSVWRLYRIFRKEKPLIVHTHTPKAGTVGMLAAKLAGVPIRLHTVAGLPLLEASGMKRRVLNLVEAATYGCAVKVYPNSFEMKKIIEKLALTKSRKLKVLANGSSNGIDLSHFDAARVTEQERLSLKERLGIAPDDFVFVFVGRLVTDKGINELVKALEEIAADNSGIKLVMVGGFEAELDPLSEETIATMNRNKSIILTGFQSDVRPYFAISDALVFPSYREGFPNVVMQAGAMGLPSIVTDINGCNEIIEDGKNGIIIPPKDTAALKEAMQHIFYDEVLRERLQENARISISSRYGREMVWEAMLEEYRRLEKEYGDV